MCERDRPDRYKGITPAMVEAGTSALSDMVPLDLATPLSGAEAVVMEVYRRMVEAATPA